MFLKIRRQLTLMWNRGGLVITLTLLILLAMSLDKPRVPLGETSIEPSKETQNESIPGYMLGDSVPANSFGWTESQKTATWRYSSSLLYKLDEGKEIASPEAGAVTAYGEKIIIDHGQGYKSEIWPIRAYQYNGTVKKGESIGVLCGQEINWKMTHYGEPVDPLKVQIVQP